MFVVDDMLRRCVKPSMIKIWKERGGYCLHFQLSVEYMLHVHLDKTMNVVYSCHGKYKRNNHLIHDIIPTQCFHTYVDRISSQFGIYMQSIYQLGIMSPVAVSLFF